MTEYASYGERENENLALVKQGYESFLKGDVEATLSAFTDDAVKIEFEAGLAEPTTLRQHFADLAEQEETVHYEPQEFIVDGDKVVAIGSYRAKVKATGQVYDDPWVAVHTVRDGKIVEVREFHDTAAKLIAHGQLKRGGS